MYTKIKQIINEKNEDKNQRNELTKETKTK